MYDETKLNRLIHAQKTLAWDLERDIDWDAPIALDKPLVPLDESALLFPGASQEERLAISQLMGLTIAACICEMEECLLRLRKPAWEDIRRKMPVNPEFNELGDLFFEEEKKHSQAFRRYIEKFANTVNIDLETLLSILPIIEKTKTEFLLKQNLKTGGQCFWWMVASVEEEFLNIFRNLRKQSDIVEPLFYDLHKKHFEEEARHAPFPYMLIELQMTRNQNIFNPLHVKADFAVAQMIKMFWALHSVSKVKLVKKLRKEHPLFEALHHALPLMENQAGLRVLWNLLVKAPYISTLTNPKAHKRVLRFADRMGSWQIPFFDLDTNPLERY